MADAKQLEEETIQYIQDCPDLKRQIEQAIAAGGLFSYFLSAVKANQYHTVSFILNTCFSNASDRANFGNRQDELGNTAYHYAAELGFDNLVFILNDKRPFKGEKKFFQYTLENKARLTPLDLVCHKGHLSTFNLIWHRANKPQHNPAGSLKYACQGASVEIVKQILAHKKCSKEQVNALLSSECAINFSPAVRSLLEQAAGKTTA